MLIDIIIVSSTSSIINFSTLSPVNAVHPPQQSPTAGQYAPMWPPVPAAANARYSTEYAPDMAMRYPMRYGSCAGQSLEMQRLQEAKVSDAYYCYYRAIYANILLL
jgi:hypothetical protein